MVGRLPFPDFILVTPVEVYNEEINEDGEREKTMLYSGPCNYSEKSKQILNAERQLITLSGKVIIKGDIAPDEQIEGYVKVGGVKKTIARCARPRNPDGSVFSTELDLS